MTNIELHLLVTMMHHGSFWPITNGDLKNENFITNEGKILQTFVANYRGETGGKARFPTLAVVKSRFANAGFVLPDPAPDKESIASLVHEVKLNKTRAEMRTIGQQILNNADSDAPLESLIEHSAQLREMSMQGNEGNYLSLREGLTDLYCAYDSGELVSRGYPWPWKTLQEHTNGIQRKEVIYILGRPKTRKTFKALYVTANCAMRGVESLVFSPEMPPKQMMLRIAALMARVRYSEFKKIRLNDEEHDRFCTLVDYVVSQDPHKHMDKLRRIMDMHDLPDGVLPTIDVIQSTNRPVSWIAAQARARGAKLIMCDSVYRQAPDKQRKSDSESTRVSDISRGMKDLVMEEDLAAIITHQLNRDAVGRVGGLENISQSDAVGQDADLAIRVLSSKLNNKPISILAILGAREIPVEGIVINDELCTDFTEISEVVNKKQIQDLMQAEEKAEAGEENRKLAQKHKGGFGGSKKKGAPVDKKFIENAVDAAAKAVA